MRTNGLGLSIFLIAAGAILAWAVEVDAEGVNLETVGFILLAVGVAGVFLTLATTAAGSQTIIEKDREVVVDRERQ